MNRRDFLKAGAAAGAAGLALPAFGAYAAGAADTKPVRVGLIGTGWYGKTDLFRLIQAAPVEVVSLCDVDTKMLADPADMVATRQASKKKPRTYGDQRDMIKEKELDIVEVATPDHWHALPMLAACEAGIDVWVQKPISVDIVESQAMLAAARKHGRTVQVGMQRRSTPHLVEARDKFVKPGALGKVGLVEIYCYYAMRARENPPDTQPPPNLDYDMWTGPAPLRPYNKLCHPRSWRAFMEYGNGIIGDMCIHMLDTVRWMLDLGWPKTVSSTGGIYVQKDSKANISDTQSATFDYGDLQVVWQHRMWGDMPAGFAYDLKAGAGTGAYPRYPWGATIYGDRGTLEASVMGYTFTPRGTGEPVHKDVVYELEQFPEDKTEKDLEKHVAPAIRAHWKNLLECRQTKAKPVSDIEQGHISTISCILANLSMQVGRALRYDPEKGTIVNDPEAQKLMRRPYRSPWVHPTPQSV